MARQRRRLTAGDALECRLSERAPVKILAIDTSTEHCSVALWCDGEIDAREAHAGQRHSELVLDMAHELLARHALRVAQIDGIAFGAGPGSFTGLRIACGVAQGLAFSAGIPVAGICTLLAMAQAAPAARLVCCLDARVREIYHAAYERSGTAWCTVHAPGLYAPAEAPLPPGEGWFGCGSGFAAYRDALARRYHGVLSGIDAEIRPHAREIARLAAREFEQGRGVDAALAAPLYVRDRVALTTAER
jgi:tRNA threonylcarbamoyladenosine biosynthesis protein TsaB